MKPALLIPPLLFCALGSAHLPSARAQTPPADPRPRVHFTADRPEVTLYRYRGPFAKEPICRAPCDRTFDPSDQLYFAGEGIRPSPRFSLDGQTGTVDMRVWSGTKGERAVGWVMIGIGASGIYGGVLLMVLHDIWMSSTEKNYAPLVAGGAVAGIGVALLVGGIFSLVRAKPTEYQFLQAGPQGITFSF